MCEFDIDKAREVVMKLEKEIEEKKMIGLSEALNNIFK